MVCHEQEKESLLSGGNVFYPADGSYTYNQLGSRSS